LKSELTAMSGDHSRSYSKLQFVLWPGLIYYIFHPGTDLTHNISLLVYFYIFHPEKSVVPAKPWFIKEKRDHTRRFRTDYLRERKTSFIRQREGNMNCITERG